MAVVPLWSEEWLVLIQLDGLENPSFRGISVHVLPLIDQQGDLAHSYMAHGWRRKWHCCHEYTLRHAHDQLPRHRGCGLPGRFPDCGGADHSNLSYHGAQRRVQHLVLLPKVGPFRSLCTSWTVHNGPYSAAGSDLIAGMRFAALEEPNTSVEKYHSLADLADTVACFVSMRPEASLLEL